MWDTRERDILGWPWDINKSVTNMPCHPPPCAEKKLKDVTWKIHCLFPKGRVCYCPGSFLFMAGCGLGQPSINTALVFVNVPLLWPSYGPGHFSLKSKESIFSP